jgi:hypothetical protein
MKKADAAKTRIAPGAIQTNDLLLTLLLAKSGNWAADSPVSRVKVLIEEQGDDSQMAASTSTSPDGTVSENEIVSKTRRFHRRSHPTRIGSGGETSSLPVAPVNRLPGNPSHSATFRNVGLA